MITKKITDYFHNLPVKEATKFLIIFYMVGIAGFLVPQTRQLFEMLIPLSLCVNLFMLFLFHKPFNKKHLLFFAGVVVFTFVIEAVGVKTGMLFGEYFYGKSLSVKLFETPLLIGFNWLMLTYGVVQLLRINTQIRKYSVVLGALLMTGYDFIMEPVAMKTDMWSWLFSQVPLQNYIAWFLVSAIVIACFELFSIKTDNKIAGRIFMLQFIFFAVLNIFLK
jgi:putative membrane protein